MKYYIRRIGHTEYYGPLLPGEMGDRSMVIADWVAKEACGQTHNQLMKVEGWMPLTTVLSEQEYKLLAAQPASPVELLRLRSRYTGVRLCMQLVTWGALGALAISFLIKFFEASGRRVTVLIFDSVKDLFLWGSIILGVRFAVMLLTDLADLRWDERERDTGKE